MANAVTERINTGRQTVAVAGTRVQLSSTSVECRWVLISAETDNTNPVTVGGSNVVGALATRQGTPLSATSPPLRLDVDNLTDVWIDVVTNTEGVTFTYGY